MKSYIAIISVFCIATFAHAQKVQKDWYQQKTAKKNMGIDLKHAYSDLVKSPGTQVIVAVIDNGTDINHPDLQGRLWHNPGEISFNGIDDDNNGYVDDTVGWNFIGGADGRMVEHDNLEMTRLLRKLAVEYKTVDADIINATDSRRERYEFYQMLKTKVEENQALYNMYVNVLKPMKKGIDQLRANLGKDDPTAAELEAYSPRDKNDENIKNFMLKKMKGEKKSFGALAKEFEDQYNQVYGMANYHYSLDFDPREIVGDNYNNQWERYYGNNNVGGPDPAHGTHVAGIIAAVRNNGFGMDGIADNVKIMTVRVVPDGDERDKDVANGIRYAVDNGARIINMSFGKSYVWSKAVVDSAVAYAVRKGVLLVHAAGNSAENNDEIPNYPNDSLAGNTFAATWLEVGASAPARAKLATDFSNYGKHNVDLFSPGYQIYSTTPNNNYEFYDGTSMASPVAAGVAALVLTQYPKLSGQQLKEILMKSAVVNKKKVVLPGSKKKTKFTDLSVTGGVVNAYNALKLAATY